MRKLLVVVTLVALGALVATWGMTAHGPAPRLVTVGAPANVPDTEVVWHAAPAPDGATTLVGTVRAPGGAGRDRPAILLVTGTEGLNVDYVQFARELAARGFDVAFGCWFRTEGPTGAGAAGIACPSAPEFKGVSDAAVPDLDALVAAAGRALDDPPELALVGFSRGGGIAMLRATHGATDPVVSVSGMLEGTTAWGNLAGEVDIVPHATAIHAPVLILHGLDDQLVPVTQAKHMEAALRAAGADVQAHYYPDGPHGLTQIPAIRADIEQRIVEWLSR